MSHARRSEGRREWRVGGALIQSDGGLLLVANRRRDDSVDWTPPGGVVDPGESVLEALTREVVEETGLVVAAWSEAVYEVDVDFGDRDMTLHVSVHVARSWTGSIVLDDPDGIVVDAGFFDTTDALDRLGPSPRWVRDPVGEWLGSPWSDPRRFNFRLETTAGGATEVVRLS